jgi:hypothetical protein
MKVNISIFLISLILFTGCGDDEDSISNDIDFFSNHAGSVWVTSNLYWLRINNDSSDDYFDGECINFPVADGTYNNSAGFQFNQTIVRNEANFVSWNLQYIGETGYKDGTLSYSVDTGGNKLTATYPSGGRSTYTKVNDTFPGSDCKN